jgi:hypothetical protein
MASRKPVIPSRVPAEVRDVLRRLEGWRKGRKHRRPIPEVLWRSATTLARQHGVSRIARLLRLDYYVLKERLDTLDRDKKGRAETKASFVEVPSFTPAADSECVVELEHPSGRRIRIQVKGGSMPDVGVLSQMFWSAEG